MEITASARAEQQSAAPEPSYEMARSFLEVFGLEHVPHTFQTVGEGARKGDASLRRTVHGTLERCWTELERLNRLGAGVFWTVNETDGSGYRKAGNIVGVRFVWHDEDRQGVTPLLPLPPHAVVETSPGRAQRYWRVTGMTREQHATVMAAMVGRWGSDPNAKDIARVLRLPGTLHQKHEPFTVRMTARFEPGWDAPVFTAAQVLEAFQPLPTEPAAQRPTGALQLALTDEVRTHDLKRAGEALRQISPDCTRDVWVKAGIALHHRFGGNDPDALELWDRWSSGGTKYPGPDEIEYQWDSFARAAGPRAGIGSLFHLAREHSPGKAWRTPPPYADPAAGFVASVISKADPTDARSRARELLEGASDIDLGAILRREANALVAGVIAPGDIGLIYGAPAAGKSFVGLDLGSHVALGKPWHGKQVAKAPVLYVALEGIEGFRKRMKGAAQHYGDAGTYFRRLKLRPSLVRGGRGDEGVAVICEAAQEQAELCGQPVGLIVIDTLQNAIAGEPENEADTMAAFIESRVETIRERTSAAVVIVHHENKAGGIRGSTVLEGASDFVLHVVWPRDERTNEATGELRYVYATKVKDGESGKLFDFELGQIQLRDPETGLAGTTCIVREASEAQAQDDQVLAALVEHWDRFKDGPFSPSKNADDAACAAKLLSNLMGASWHDWRDVQASLERLEKAGKIRRVEFKPAGKGKARERWEPVIDALRDSAGFPPGSGSDGFGQVPLRNPASNTNH